VGIIIWTLFKETVLFFHSYLTKESFQIHEETKQSSEIPKHYITASCLRKEKSDLAWFKASVWKMRGMRKVFEK
jgi:hypothetical protein